MEMIIILSFLVLYTSYIHTIHISSHLDFRVLDKVESKKKINEKINEKKKKCKKQMQNVKNLF